MYLQKNVPFKMFELERSEMQPNSSQHALSSVIHQLRWVQLTGGGLPGSDYEIGYGNWR